ncbi:MAG: bifunctional phosphopantothenoylcysteine decarboxylase/phosphopantothenate--cysteine ligase CoaBC [Longimicrobiales bacterium]
MAQGLAPRRPWQGRRVVLGVTGGIAAYKAVQVARDLTLLGAHVDVVMTRAACEFVGPITFESLTGRPVLTELIRTGGALDHIRLGRDADVICVAPATADFLARAAAGRADDLLGAVLLATRAPVVLCPAMNDWMWSHPQTQTNARHVQEALGYTLVGPATGPLAHGEGEGEGRLEEADVIIGHIGRALEGETPFSGRRFVVTAGPTREPVDAVRVLSNRSSGRMGYAVAAAAWRRGADVVLITGPSPLDAPPGVSVQRIQTAAEMETAVRQTLAGADVLVMAAAVADFRPAHTARGKLKKQDGVPSLELERAPDILVSTRPNRPTELITVGFALESGTSGNGLAYAREKLQEKGLDLVVLNLAGEPGSGFETDTNRVTLIDSGGTEESLPLLPKDEVADAILDRLERLMPSRV